GTFIGGPICTSLNTKLGAKFTRQGVGAPGYPGLFLDNVSMKGTCETCITSAVKTFQDVATKCPDAKIAFLGYSQGAAIMHNAIPLLAPELQSKLVAGVLFVDTQNKQSKASIKGFPAAKLKTFCATDDGVCGGYLNVNAGHVSYGEKGDTEKAAEWLAAQFGA
ncbi:cutinase, partial [Tothia fuscella]